MAGGTIAARLVRLAFIHLSCTVDAFITGLTLAAICIHQVDTVAIDAAVVARTVIDVVFASRPIESGWAEAHVSGSRSIAEAREEPQIVFSVETRIGALETGSPVLAGWRRRPWGVTVRYVNFTGTALIGLMAVAMETTHTVFARAAMLAGARVAVINVPLTVCPFKARVSAVALKPIDKIQATCSVEAWSRLALVNINFTASTLVARRTVATKSIDLVQAGSPVHAGTGGTLVKVYFAVVTQIATRADALVLVHPVHTGRSIEAGL